MRLQNWRLPPEDDFCIAGGPRVATTQSSAFVSHLCRNARASRISCCPADLPGVPWAGCAYAGITGMQHNRGGNRIGSRVTSSLSPHACDAGPVGPVSRAPLGFMRLIDSFAEALGPRLERGTDIAPRLKLLKPAEIPAARLSGHERYLYLSGCRIQDLPFDSNPSHAEPWY
jgi:hypothetical protein